MALAQDTDYIVLDEPTTYLDISHQLSLMQTLRELAAEGKGVIAVMHDLPISFTFADTVAVLDNGIVKENTSPDKLCTSGIIEEVFGVAVDFLQESGEYRYRYNK